MNGARWPSAKACEARRGGMRTERGAALIEFALVSLVLYLMLAGAVEFGRLMFGANVLQDAARVAARELALAPIRANVSLDYALSCNPLDEPVNCLVDLRRRVFDPACLVVDFSDPAVSPDPDGYFAAMPVVNQVLRSLMITEPSRPDHQRACGEQLLLAFDADLRQQNMAAVAQQLFVVHNRVRSEGRIPRLHHPPEIPRALRSPL